ncbi:CDGSH iron-sulfur domain-containing protein 2 homolog [Harmonia axyridis]|uniref:CDGSH iron-sulfur domain-containing protein 2 homolog n=1 Tax=Harmonia axyridis TaxID=115357 RepID=UPI001E275659|nr:CDGSH iron-sulfur domain-containing protein 2 homolog [Harmonia axyridis]
MAQLIKVTLPNYLSNLPIPDTAGGWFRLSLRDWISLIPPFACVAGATYVSYLAFCPKARAPPCGKVNPKILKNSPKVVDIIDVEDITEKAVFCRCWRSKNWPYCDGSHGTYNKENDDNVGPLIVKKE